jgi:hypothetical protein
MRGGRIENGNMNQEELIALQTEPSTLRRNIFQSTRVVRIVAVAALITSTLGCHNPAHDNMEVMIKHAQQQFTPDKLQAAVADLCATNGSYIPVQNLPHEILSLSDTKPSFCFFLDDEKGKRTLLVTWGGEMFSWGIGVCPPGGLLVTNMAHARVYRWSDGVFFFCEP